MSVFLICIVLILLIIFHTNNADKLKSILGSVRRVQHELQALKLDMSPDDLSGSKKKNEGHEKYAPKPKPIVSQSSLDKSKSKKKETKKEKDDYNIIPAQKDKLPIDENLKVPKKTEESKKKENIEIVEELSEEQFEKKYGVINEVVEEEIIIPAKKVQASRSVNRPPIKLDQKPTPGSSKEGNFVKSSTDWEKFIGQNLMNKIGIAILVLGIGFFVKFAIDQEWINEIGRVSIGILSGGLLLGIAHVIRKNYKTFSSILVGGGLAVFYITIALAFHEYNLFSQSMAFGIMTVITGISVFMAIVYDRIELAILSLIGGFIAPFLVSQGTGNYVVLFTYMAILNIGMMVLAYFKNWKLVSTISYVLTIIVYSGWLSMKVLSVPAGEIAPYKGAFLFAAIFFLIFFITNIIYNIRKAQKFSGIQFSILLSNNLFFFSAGIAILTNINEGMYNGLFTAAMGLINLIFTLVLYWRKNVDKNLLYLLVGLVITFISLIAPVQLEGNHITLFWATELVLMLFLANKSGIKLLYRGAIGLSVLLVISLGMDWIQLYLMDHQGELSLIFNKAFITGIISGTALFVASRVCQNSDEMLIAPIKKSNFRGALATAGIITAYAAILFEFIYQLNISVHLLASRILIITLFNLIMISVGIVIANYKNKSLWKEILFVLSLLSIFIYPFFLHPNIVAARSAYFNGSLKTNAMDGFIGFGSHYLILGLIIFLMIQCILYIKNKFDLRSDTAKGFYWLFSAIGLFILSSELDHSVLLVNFNKTSFNANYLLKQTHKIGYPILWGISSFGLMLLGMKNRLRTLRIISLSIFGVILLKLFIIDLKGMTQGGRIASFIILGVLLLTISFLYQKVKELFFEKDVESPTNQ